jgi:hypothetical protein
MKFKVGKMYYAEMKEKGMFSSNKKICVIFILKGSHYRIPLKGRMKILDCIPMASNHYLDWSQLPIRETLEIKEVSIEDLPLYLNLEKQTPKFQELLKKGLPNDRRF